MGKDRLTADELAAIKRYEGRVVRPERGEPRPERRDPVPPMLPRESSARMPRARAVLPAEMSVWEALQWAFGTEQAQMDADEVGASSGGQRRGMSPEAVLEQRFMLGNVTIDTSPGRSSPAEEADVIASVVRATLRWSDAVWIADLARAGRVPDAMVGEVPRLVPVEWTHGRGGYIGRRADSSELETRPQADPCEPVGWEPVPRRNRKGVIVRDAVWFTPCTWTPTANQIGMARRRYLDWWGHLLSLQVALRAARLRRFEINRSMPPMTPWIGRQV